MYRKVLLGCRVIEAHLAGHYGNQYVLPRIGRQRNTMKPLTPSNKRPIVTLMTDFGLSDAYVGMMKGVIIGIVPRAHLIDLTHDIPPQNVLSAAWILATAYRYFPQRTVHICVVDPGVGSSRQAIALHAGDWFFVGPDNGLFSYILMEQTIQTAVNLSNSNYHLPQVSATFHGRDLFAPVGAHLARGASINQLGTPIDPATLQRLDIASPTRQETHIDAHIVHVDHFGNLITTIPLTLVPDLFSNETSAQLLKLIFPTHNIVVERFNRFFSAGLDDGQPFIYNDSSGYLGIAIRNGNAAQALNVIPGTPIIFLTEHNDS